MKMIWACLLALLHQSRTYLLMYSTASASALFGRILYYFKITHFFKSFPLYIHYLWPHLSHKLAQKNKSLKLQKQKSSSDSQGFPCASSHDHVSKMVCYYWEMLPLFLSFSFFLKFLCMYAPRKMFVFILNLWTCVCYSTCHMTTWKFSLDKV